MTHEKRNKWRVPASKWVCKDHNLGLSENRLNPEKPNGFADHYPYTKWLFHWGYTMVYPIFRHIHFCIYVYIYILVGGLEHVLCLMTFQKQLGISSSQLLLTPSFFRGVGLNHQPIHIYIYILIYIYIYIYIYIHIHTQAQHDVLVNVCLETRDLGREY